MTNCPNCGAPISQEKCPYCGTVLLDFAAIQLGHPCYVKFKIDGGYILTKLVVERLNIEHNTESADYRDGLGCILKSVVCSHSIDFHMDAHAVFDDKLHLLTYIQTEEAVK